MDLSKYPDLSVELEDGRRVKVHAFIWEPCYSELKEIGSGKKRREVEIERKRIQTETLIAHRPTHYIGPEYVDIYQNDPPRIPNSSITVFLSSEPLSKDALFSELVVVFFMDYEPGFSLESILKRGLHDLDWEEHAEDVSDQINELWKEVWLVRTVH